MLSILEAIPQNDWPSLLKYLASPFLNSHQEVLQLGQYLIDKLRKTNVSADALSHQAISNFLYPGKPFRDLRIRHISSQLVKCIESWLVWKELQAANQNEHYWLALAYGKLGLQKFATHSIVKAADFQEKTPIRNQQYHYTNALIAQENYNLRFSRKEEDHQPIYNFFQDLEAHYMSHKLQGICSLLSHVSVFELEIDLAPFEELIQSAMRQNLTEYPAIGIYIPIYHILTQQNPDQAFQSLKQNLQHFSTSFSAYEVRSLYLFAINYCIREARKGDAQYELEQFRLYQEALKAGALYDKGYLSPWTYKNIVATGLKIQKFAWVGQFLDEYKLQLPKQYREDVYAYCSALLALGRGQFDQAIRILYQLQIDDLLTSLDARVLLIQAHYENELPSISGNMLDTLEKQLRKRKLPKQTKAYYLEFVKYARRLIRVNGYDKTAILKLQSKIESAPAMAQKTWLLDKVSSLSG